MTVNFPYSFALATVANGQSLSGSVSLGGKQLVGILMPATWTAASITFQGSLDGTNFFDIYDYTGAEVTVTAVQNHMVSISPFFSVSYMKCRSGTGGSPVNQGQASLLTLVLRTPIVI